MDDSKPSSVGKLPFKERLAILISETIPVVSLHANVGHMHNSQDDSGVKYPKE